MKNGEVSSPHVGFDFVDVKAPQTAFKRVVRDLEFDVAELAIVTFLMAKAHGKPLVLLPAVVVGRFAVADAAAGGSGSTDRRRDPSAPQGRGRVRREGRGR